MSRERLNELRMKLESLGMCIRPGDDCSSLYSPVQERLYWLVGEEWQDINIKVCFFLFSDFGNVTSDLKDILYATIEESDLKLLFHKRASKEWIASVDGFAYAIRALYTKIVLASKEKKNHDPDDPGTIQSDLR